MNYRVRDGLHYCHVSSHIVFLNLVADRYFALQPDKAAQFDRLLSGAELAAETTAIASSFMRQNLLVESDAELDKPPVLPELGQSLAITRAPTPSMRRSLEALTSLVKWRVRYSRRGLPAIAARYRLGSGPVDFEPRVSVADIIAAFSWAEQIVTAHDHCVPRSVALASTLRANGFAPTVVIGVQLRPFAAHCWVQLGADIANDQLDTIRPYTPILVM
ncbi:lasso peptide biosynthesis B2 protein [Sphingomonas sp. CGMCC 1.13654]|uniref:Lasso peptide biosynthesis B2 protein n=1 Tax=Sphingomonas chungangi TaxID=2683589 RepID=A0A838L7F0_9SPHN|nr:lasso peptide biosynthesis B2 protein [Sphingomonas chungangi]MBA2934622.1 lasso peptide biosynthesis B2 protein [Sphingomonas chungangi]MVW57658.1 lasso peptide biosynthesis B2 protein [Sphingomonas chungangi]